MNQKLIDFNKSQKRSDIPEIQTGDIVRVHKKIKEGEKERVQVIKGLIIAIKGRQSSSPTITLKREGVEMIFPIYLPAIQKIEVLRHSKIRRSKIYYMRKRSGKSAKMKIKDFSEAEKSETKRKDLEKEKSKKESTEKSADNGSEKQKSSEQSLKENSSAQKKKVEDKKSEKKA